MADGGDISGPEKSGPESEISEEHPPGAGAGDPSSQGGEGARNAETTPKLDEGGEAGQDQTPADPDDVGVPSDEEMERDTSGDAEE